MAAADRVVDEIPDNLSATSYELGAESLSGRISWRVWHLEFQRELKW